MPVCHCMGLHQEWADSADATTVAPTLVGREKARHCPLRKVSTGGAVVLEPSRRRSRCSPCGSTAPNVAACGSSTSGELCREATTSPGALALSLALEITVT